MKYPILLGLALMAASCSNEKTFEIKGVVSDADGQTLYLESAGSGSTTVLDSAKLKSNGKFEFKRPAVSAPEFFTLRLGKQSITLAVDSCETVSLNAPAAKFATDYTLTDSPENDKIKDITLRSATLRQQIVSLGNQYTARNLDAQSYNDALRAAIDDYKTAVKPYIYENPGSAAAYFALFQRVDGLLLFDPYDKQDYSAYGAVATWWDTYRHDADRTRQLVAITLNALRDRRAQSNAEQTAQNIEVKEQNQIDIALPDVKGRTVKLSDQKGKVVLLDFTAYQADYSGPYNMQLAKLYEQFKDRGFEIYQVSLDADDNFWKVTASNLPWITVRDKETVYSAAARSYNVTTLPTVYLIARDGSIVARGSEVKDVESQIGKLLNAPAK